MATFARTAPSTGGRPGSTSSPRRRGEVEPHIRAFMDLFTAQSTDHARMTPHGLNKSTGLPYKKYIRQPGQPITAAMVADHLGGRITLATQPQRGGLARGIEWDLDEGQDLQAAIDDLARLGLGAFAVGSWSARPDGAPAHQGGHVWLLIDQAHDAGELGAIAQVLAGRIGLGDIEHWPRPGVDIRLPFGRNQRAQAGREWGALYLPHSAPIELTSGRQGLAELLRSYRPAPLAQVLAYAPAPAPAIKAPQAAPFAPGTAKATPGDRLDSSRLIQEFNARFDVRTVLESFGGKAAGPQRYLCPCGQHSKGQEDSIKIAPLTKGGYGARVFGANCRLYGKTHDAYGVLQTLGGYSTGGAMDEARRWLNLPAFEPAHARPAPRPSERPATPAPAVGAPQLVLHAAQLRACRDCTLVPAARRVLVVLLDQAAGQGWCKLSLRAIHLAADCCESTARRALYTLRDRGYITIDNSGNAYGGSEANYYTFISPLDPPAQQDSAVESHGIGGGVIAVTPDMVLNTQYGGANSAPGGGQLDQDAQLTSAGPMDASEWDSLIGLAPLADDEMIEPRFDESPPPYCEASALGAPADQESTPAQPSQPTPPPPAALAAQQPAPQLDPASGSGAPLLRPVTAAQARKVLKAGPAPAAAPRRYMGKPGPNAAALAILMQDPTYTPGQPDLPPAPPAPAGPAVDPPPALLDQAAALITEDCFSEYEALKAQHPGYDWASCTDQRASYRRWSQSRRPGRAQAPGAMVDFYAGIAA